MKKIIKSKWFEAFCILVILLLAFGVRLYKIQNPLDDWHAWRQSDTATVSQIYVDHGIDLLNPRYYDISPTQTGVYNPEGLRFVEFPIFNLINVVLFKINEFVKPANGFTLEVWARLISVFCAVGSTFFLYLIGKKFADKRVGLLAAFFYAILPYNIYFTRVILPEPMTVFLFTTSLWAFLKYTERESKFNLFLSAILFSLAMLLKPFIFFYFPVYLYLLVKKYGWIIVRTGFLLRTGFLMMMESDLSLPGGDGFLGRDLDI
jgi:asparagine N-glycosylation enzyme membrane subunit Stt3